MFKLLVGKKKAKPLSKDEETVAGHAKELKSVLYIIRGGEGGVVIVEEDKGVVDGEEHDFPLEMKC